MSGSSIYLSGEINHTNKLVYFYRNGKAIEYSGGRTADTIVSWLEKKTGPPAKTLDTVETAKSFIEDAEVAVVGFFKVRDLHISVEFNFNLLVGRYLFLQSWLGTPELLDQRSSIERSEGR